MIIVKTGMIELPDSCLKCELKIIAFGNIGCPIKKDWIEKWQLKYVRRLKDCPLEKIKLEKNKNG